MGRAYATEMAELAETFASAMSADIGSLRRAVKIAGHSPLLAIGSGGSLTAAHALAGLHRRCTGQLSAVATPLEALAEPLEPRTAVWLLSAGGRNVDILAALRALVGYEPRQLAVLCADGDSPLADAARAHGFVDLLMYEPSLGKDGFLATNSLLGFVTLLTRAYLAEFTEEDANAFAEPIHRLLMDADDASQSWRSTAEPLWTRDTTVVLHGTETRLGAIDLESKFVEAALGNLQTADYRNFAHGRHHWLAKRPDTTGVLALISASNRALADRTLALLPRTIPQARLSFEGPTEAVALASLIAAFRLAGWSGEARGIDPGRPGVPDFGRKLFHLRLPKESRAATEAQLADRDAVAIERKSGLRLTHLSHHGTLSQWRDALVRFRNRLLNGRFAGLVLDYDGTVVDTRERFAPPRAEMAAELVRLLDSGARVAVATGRGVSVRRDLRACLPEPLWPRVLVGYYNGAEIRTLADDVAPDNSDTVCSALAPLAAALRNQPELSIVAVQTDRRFQITLEAKRPVPENRLWDLAHQAMLIQGVQDALITRSSHSVDIVGPGVSKLSVVAALRLMVGPEPVLAVGDRGRWPGNDYLLLREPFSLSVDEVSVDPDTCWNLAPRGQRGIAVTLEYLRELSVDQGTLAFREAALQ